MLTFRVLGPVEVCGPGRAAVTLPPAVRALLARLALSPGRVLPVDLLTDALWGEELPADAGNALQLRVSKLRRALTAAGLPADTVATRAPGYRLAVPAAAVDAHRFADLLGTARAAAGRDDPGSALAAVDEALALWRGPALADIGPADWAQAERTRLEEMRLGAAEERLEVLLALGRSAEAVADLEALAAAHPLRERPHRLLLLALYRCGRQADALHAYRALRRHLADELGIDPSPELRQLAESILRQDVPPAAVSTSRPAPREDRTHDAIPPAQPPAAVVPPTPPRGGTAAIPHGAAATPPGGTAVPPPTPTAPASQPAVCDLPPRLSSLVGRGADLAAVRDRLAEARVVTLTGPGGIGKTTLALEVARSVADGFPGGVRLVRLAAVPAGGDLAGAVAGQLGLSAAGAAASVRAVADTCAGAPALLLLDNCEHVVDEAAVLVEQLVAAAPALTVLATSREALAVAGEMQVSVAPLDLPAPRADADAIAAAAAVRLFVDRARAVRPSFALDADTAPVIAALCRQLDGMPLAIELAAARVKALSPAEIALRLQDRFALLTGAARRTAEARHRTLRATLDWSHELLTDAERVLLRRLAVFQDGWTVPAAEQVCGFADLDRGEVLDLLLRLVDRSLVVAEPDTGRFRLLMTVRDYAAQRLAEAGEVPACRDRHLTHFTGYARANGPHVAGGAPGYARLSADAENLRAAMAHALASASADPGPALALAAALFWYWNYSLRHEGVRALTALLALDLPPAGRATALQGLGLLHVYYPTPESRAAARESLALFTALGDTANAAISRLIVAWEGQYGGDPATYRAMLAESRPVLTGFPGPWWLALTHYLEASIDLRAGAFGDSAAQWRRAWDLLTEAGDLVLVSAVQAHLAVALRQTGAPAEAAALLREAVALARGTGTLHGLAFALVHLAHTLLDLPEGTREAAALLVEADVAARRARNPRCQAWAAWGRARTALAAGSADAAADECATAVRLLGDGEFPWARRQLWSFTATAAEAAARPQAAARARAAAAAVS